MEITHVLRGEDLLSSTPRQIALYKALIELGVAKDDPGLRPPAVRHGRGQQEALQARPAGLAQPLPRARLPPRGPAQLPLAAGLVALRGPDIFSIDEMVAAFDIADVNANPARFDLKKAEAINADHIRLLDVKAFTEACGPWLQAPFAPWAPGGLRRGRLRRRSPRTPRPA